MSKNLFPGMLVTLLVLIFSTSAVKAHGQQDSVARKTVKALLLHATPVTFPESNTNGASSPEIKATGSFSHLQTSLCIRVNHSLFCLFEIAFQKPYSEDPRPQIDIALNGFFLTLFCDIIAPNAP